MKHLCVKLGDLAASVFEIPCEKKQTDTQTNGGKNLIPATAIGVGN